MNYFPFFFNLKNKTILIFGGKKEALYKIEKLLNYSANIVVISPKIIDEIKNNTSIEYYERDFQEKDLDINPMFVITAENIEKTRIIYNACKKRNILVNSVDKIDYCDFIFPSVVASEHLSVGISSGGISPTATVVFKEKISNIIPKDIDDILEWMHDTREYIAQNYTNLNLSKTLKIIFNKVLELGRVLNKDELDLFLKSLY